MDQRPEALLVLGIGLGATMALCASQQQRAHDANAEGELQWLEATVEAAVRRACSPRDRREPQGVEVTLAQLEVLLSRGQLSPERVDALVAECRRVGQPDTTSGRWRSFVGDDCDGMDRIKIVSYNVLADMYAMRNPTKHAAACPVDALPWKTRRHRILHELEHYRAECVCLQEVEATAFEEDFEVFLAAAGYSGLHVLRTPWEQLRAGESEDGIAIFWRTDSLRLEAKQEALYSDLVRGSSCVFLEGSDSHAANIAKEKGAVLVALFTHLHTGKQIVIANTHLFHSPRHADIKVSQAAMFANLVNDFAHNQRVPDVPVVLCGDFNSQPQLNHNEIRHNPNDVSLRFHGGEQSGVVELLSTGGLHALHMHHPASWNPLKNGDLGPIKLSGNRRYSSAYQRWLGVEPAFTTRTTGFTDTIDYLWLSDPGRLCGVLGGVPVPDVNEFEACLASESDSGTLHGMDGDIVPFRRGVAPQAAALASVANAVSFPESMPDARRFPSDHLAIGCVLKL